jgi:hypothetical protein
VCARGPEKMYRDNICLNNSGPEIPEF